MFRLRLEKLCHGHSGVRRRTRSRLADTDQGEFASTVTDWILIRRCKRFDAKGQVLGEQRFLGLYTSTAYASPPADIPLLRRKVNNVVTRAGFDPNGHMGKALVTILDQYPRDELFQISEDELFEHAIGIVALGYRQRTRLFVLSDLYGRFLSCLVYVPHENYNTELRKRTQQILMHAFNGISGEMLFAGGGADERMSLVRRFQTPIVVNGRIFVAADDKLYAFVIR
jgi:NAD-specific glutamate dehydrogenase